MFEGIVILGTVLFNSKKIPKKSWNTYQIFLRAGCIWADRIIRSVLIPFHWTKLHWSQDNPSNMKQPSLQCWCPAQSHSHQFPKELVSISQGKWPGVVCQPSSPQFIVFFLDNKRSVIYQTSFFTIKKCTLIYPNMNKKNYNSLWKLKKSLC